MNSDANPQIPAAVDHSAVAEQVNSAINYAMYAVWRVDRRHSLNDRAEKISTAVAGIPGLNVRGWYDVSGFRADADIMVWWWADNTEALQEAYRTVTSLAAGALVPVWSGIGVHRAAEFNRGHVPAFLAGDEPRGYLCVYPFVRSYEWYLLPEAERREMLREHGAAARDYGDVLANTIASFALSDYEWLLGFESDDLIRIVDLMRELRDTEARRHVREEIPFFTGPRVPAEELLRRFGKSVHFSVG